MNNLTYRTAELSDLPEIVEIYNSIVASRMVTADLQPATVDSRKDWFTKHTPDRRPLWMVENDAKETVGWISYENFVNGRAAYDITAEVSIYLAESQRGKGVGREVLQYAIDKAPSLGIENIVALIFAHNHPSLKLFEKLGFATWGDFPEVAVLDGEKRSLKILGRRV